MKIAVIGANGKAGRLIVSEAVRRGAEVTAVVRSDNRSETPCMGSGQDGSPQYSIKSFEQSFEWKQYTSSRSRRSRQFVY